MVIVEKETRTYLTRLDRQEAFPRELPRPRWLAPTGSEDVTRANDEK